ncbi:MAG: glycosyltransferase [Parcubacteria group bacterium Athens0714_24]|nr:MAG: glycosyltransferase [Parcubacteria group bacterium Athens0714_24]
MRILVISTDRKLFEENSGVRQRIVEYGSLVEEMHIVVFSKRQSQISNLKSQKFGNVFLYPTNSRSRWFYICDAIKIGKKILSNKGQWLITTQDPFECGWVGYWLAKKFKISLQLQIHTDFLSPYFVKESVLNKIRIYIAKFLIPRANCIRVVSERIKNSLKKDSVVLPIFVDVQKIREAPIKTDLHSRYSQFNFIILMAGRLTKEKNINFAIEAIKEIGDKNIGLIIVGGRLIEEKMPANIIFESWTDDLASYYKTADLFLLTSNYEGYGMTLVEAAAAGCKIISTDVGIAREILEEENICRVGDKNDLKEKIKKAIMGEIKSCRNLRFKAKEKYLEEYKKNWESCGF